MDGEVSRDSEILHGSTCEGNMQRAPFVLLCTKITGMLGDKTHNGHHNTISSRRHGRNARLRSHWANSLRGFIVASQSAAQLAGKSLVTALAHRQHVHFEKLGSLIHRSLTRPADKVFRLPSLIERVNTNVFDHFTTDEVDVPK